MSGQGSDDEFGVRFNQLMWGGDGQHHEDSQEIVGEHIGDVFTALNLIAYVLEHSEGEMPFANSVGSVGCFTKAFRGLRGATMLCSMGYYNEARTVVRGIYESSGLGYLLSKQPELADKWLRKNQWVPNRDVRAFIESQSIDDESPSIFARFYKYLSAFAHPSAISAIPLVIGENGNVDCKIASVFDANTTKLVMGEIVTTAIFVAFTLQRTIADESLLPPKWRQSLIDLTRKTTGDALPELDRDWQKEQERFERLQTHFLTAEELEIELDRHPNSIRNVKRRSAEAVDT